MASKDTNTPNPTYVPAVDVEKLPGVYLRHSRGGHLIHRSATKGAIGPGHTMEGEPDVFLIVPLKSESNKSDEQSQDEVDKLKATPALAETFDSFDESVPSPRKKFGSGLSSQEYEEVLLRATHVAIAYRADDGTLRYISCRRGIPVMKRSMAEYRSRKIGHFEAFKPEYSFHTNTYSFESHNGLYLYWSSKLNSVQFKSGATDSTKWQAEAVDLSAKIAYLGVVSFAAKDTDNGINFLTESIAPGLPIDRDDFLAMVRILKECHQPGECWMTCFDKPEDGTRWVAKTNEESVCFLLIASQHYPKFVGIECIDDLHASYDVKYKKLYSNSKTPTVEVSECYAKELFAQRLHYEDLEGVWETEVPDEIKASMQENFEVLTRNIERAQELEERTSQLEEDAKMFRRKAAEYKSKSKSLNTQAVMLAAGASAGAAFGWLVGGPMGAAALGSQAIEIAVGTAFGLASGGALHRVVDTSRSFWKYKFVRVSPPTRPNYNLKQRSFFGGGFSKGPTRG